MKNLILCVCFVLSACVTQPGTLYQALGGHEKIEQIVDNFIYEIESDEKIFPYFKESDTDRFREKFIEHLCMETGGPCEYKDDTMEMVHRSMNITESDFNRTVDLLINAMNKADISHPKQNRVLAVLAPTREKIIYQ